MLAHSGFYEDMALLRKDGYLAFATLSVRALEAEKTGGQNVAFCILHDMGAKKSMERDLLAKHRGVALSSNYSLYADMSRRMMSVIGQFAPEQEVYSIDESFLRFRGFAHWNLSEQGRALREGKETGRCASR